MEGGEKDRISLRSSVSRSSTRRALCLATAGLLVLCAVQAVWDSRERGVRDREKERIALLQGAQGEVKTADWDGMLSWAQKPAEKARLRLQLKHSFISLAGKAPMRSTIHAASNSSQLWTAPDVSKFNLTLDRSCPRRSSECMRAQDVHSVHDGLAWI